MLTAAIIACILTLLWLVFRSGLRTNRENRALESLNVDRFFAVDEGYHGLDGTTIAVDHTAQIIGVWHETTGAQYFNREGIASVELAVEHTGEMKHKTLPVLGRYVLGRIIGGPSLGEVAGLTSAQLIRRHITSITLELHLRDSRNPLVRIAFFRGSGNRRANSALEAAVRWKGIVRSVIS